MGVKVENINGVLYVKISPEYKKPWWSDFMYDGKYKELEDGSILFPCRNTNVTITKPVMQQTHMGVIQTNQTYIEKWVYFDVPQLSILVTEGTDLLKHWSLDLLGLELKETQALSTEEKHNEETLNETV